MGITPYKFGLLGEFVTSLLYRFKFYKILARRFKTKYGEIDIICVRFNTLVFIEVKSRKQDYDDILCFKNQQQRIVRAAQYFIYKNPTYAKYDLRFDLALIKPYCWPVLLENFIVT